MCPPMQKENRGSGVTSGIWGFEEFEFLPGVLGRGFLSYDADAVRAKKCDIEPGNTGRPYEIELKNPVVQYVEIFDDDGNSIPLNADDKCAAEKMLLAAWRDASDTIVDFEMGLL